MAFRDGTASFAARADDVLSRLDIAEKIAMLHQYAPAVPRLGLAAFRTGSETLHGVAWRGEATVFPQAVGLAASWDPELLRSVGVAVSEELREFHRHDPTVSLIGWAPVVNLLRDPRWGRNEEGYAEDPLLTARLAIGYCRGMRGDHAHYWRAAPLLKHFLAYNNEDDRATTSSTVRPRVLHEYDLVPFREIIAAGVAVGVMPSYNLVNGRPNHVSPLLRLLREQTTADLIVCSDAYAPSNLVDPEHYFDDHVESHAAALLAGVDSFTDNGDDPAPTVARLTEALARGLISESDIDRAVRRLLLVRLSLGEFDHYPESVVDYAEHQRLARRAARESVVLLKNTGVLPLAVGSGAKVAVLGPFADALAEDWYSGTMPYRVTVADGLRAVLADVVSDPGVDRISLRVNGVDELFDVFDWGAGIVTLRSVSQQRYATVTEDGEFALGPREPGGWVVRETFLLERDTDGTVALRHEATGRYLDPSSGTLRESATPVHWHVVRSAGERVRALLADVDTAVVVVGNDPHINGRETQDRPFLGLPDAQESLVRLVRELVPRTILVVMSSYPIALPWADANLPAIIWTSHAGQETGHALADVLVGTYSPSGRLPQTWYATEADLPDPLDYDIISATRTYLYFPGAPLYPFGHGLSYTTFAHSTPRLEPSVVDPDEPVRAEIDVTNTGQVAGSDVVQCYVTALDPRHERPIRQLAGFAKVPLEPGETATVTVEVARSALSFWDVASDSLVVDPGEYEIQFGRSCADITGSATLTVRGRRPAARPMLGTVVRAADFDDQVGTTLVDVRRTDGDAVATVDDRPGWLLFRAADLRAGAGKVEIQVSRTEPGPATVEFRRDAVAGPVLAELVVPSTGDRYAWTTVGGEFAGDSGVFDLYVVLRGAQRISELCIEREA